MSLTLNVPNVPRSHKLSTFLMLGIGFQVIYVLSLELLALERLGKFNAATLGSSFVLVGVVLGALRLGVYVYHGPKLKNPSLRQLVGSSLPLCAIMTIIALNPVMLAQFFNILRGYALPLWCQTGIYALCLLALPTYLIGQTLAASYERLERLDTAPTSVFILLGISFLLAGALSASPLSGFWILLASLSLLVFTATKTLSAYLLMLGILVSAYLLNSL